MREKSIAAQLRQVRRGSRRFRMQKQRFARLRVSRMSF
jgi:hypothetical protein